MIRAGADGPPIRGPAAPVCDGRGGWFVRAGNAPFFLHFCLPVGRTGPNFRTLLPAGVVHACFSRRDMDLWPGSDPAGRGVWRFGAF